MDGDSSLKTIEDQNRLEASPTAGSIQPDAVEGQKRRTVKTEMPGRSTRPGVSRISGTSVKRADGNQNDLIVERQVRAMVACGNQGRWRLDTAAPRPSTRCGRRRRLLATTGRNSPCRRRHVRHTAAGTRSPRRFRAATGNGRRQNRIGCNRQQGGQRNELAQRFHGKFILRTACRRSKKSVEPRGRSRPRAGRSAAGRRVEGRADLLHLRGEADRRALVLGSGCPQEGGKEFPEPGASSAITLPSLPTRINCGIRRTP